MNSLSTQLIEKGTFTLYDITIFDNDEYNKIIKYWFERIFDYIEQFIESLNRKIKDLKRNSRGYRNFEHLRSRFCIQTEKK